MSCLCIFNSQPIRNDPKSPSIVKTRGISDIRWVPQSCHRWSTCHCSSSSFSFGFALRRLPSGTVMEGEDLCQVADVAVVEAFRWIKNDSSQKTWKHQALEMGCRKLEHINIFDLTYLNISQACFASRSFRSFMYLTSGGLGGLLAFVCNSGERQDPNPMLFQDFQVKISETSWLPQF